MDLSGIDVSGIDTSGLPDTQSTLDAAIQALQIVAGVLGLIFYILVVYRLVGYAAFDNLHRLYPFRVLICIYTAIFAPVFIPYYLFRSIRSRLNLGGTPPRFKSVFPIEVAPPKKGEDPYDPKNPMNSAREFFFGWPNENDNRKLPDGTKENIADSIASKATDYFKKLEDHVSDKPKPALNSTIQALLTGGGVLFIGVIFSGLMYAIYQAFQPSQSPPVCESSDSGEEEDVEEEYKSKESMTDKPASTPAPVSTPAPASAPGLASTPAPVQQAKEPQPELNKWNVLKALSFPALLIPQPQLSLSSLLPTTAVNFFQRL